MSRQRGQAARAPVDDPLGAVDQAVVVQPLEDGLHGPGQALVHGEPLAGPVDAVAEPAHLAEDRAAGLGLPLPDPLDERLPAEVVAATAPRAASCALDHVLGGDAGVVHAGQPQRLVALHPLAAGERVHEGVVEGVADVQRPVTFGGGMTMQNGGLSLAGVGGEVAGRYPLLVPSLLYLARLVLGGEAAGGPAVRGTGCPVHRSPDESTEPRPAALRSHRCAGPRLLRSGIDRAEGRTDDVGTRDRSGHVAARGNGRADRGLADRAVIRAVRRDPPTPTTPKPRRHAARGRRIDRAGLAARRRAGRGRGRSAPPRWRIAVAEGHHAAAPRRGGRADPRRQRRTPPRPPTTCAPRWPPRSTSTTPSARSTRDPGAPDRSVLFFGGTTLLWTPEQ